MAASYRTHIAISWTALSATHSVTLPASVQANDIIYLSVAQGATGTLAAPTGYALVRHTAPTSPNPYLDLFSKVATAGDASAVVTVSDNSAKGAMVAYIVQGADTTTPTDVSVGGGDSSSSTSHPNPAITTVANNDFVVAFFGNKDAVGLTTTAITEPAGYTLRMSKLAGSTTQAMIAVAEQGPISPAGTVASGNWTTDTASSNGSAIVIAIKSATVAGTLPLSGASATNFVATLIYLKTLSLSGASAITFFTPNLTQGALALSGASVGTFNATVTSNPALLSLSGASTLGLQGITTGAGPIFMYVIKNGIWVPVGEQILTGTPTPPPGPLMTSTTLTTTTTRATQG